MSATMPWQGGWVQLEQSDKPLPLNMVKMTNGGFSLTAMEETQCLIKKPRAEVQKEKMRGVEIPGHQGEAWDRKTPGYASSKPHSWMPSLPKLHCKESADMMVT